MPLPWPKPTTSPSTIATVTTRTTLRDTALTLADRFPGRGTDPVNIVVFANADDPVLTSWLTTIATMDEVADVSIRPGWFWHPAEDAAVRTVDDLVELYFSSVGRNSKLLLNVPPTREGLLHPTDVANLLEMRRRLDEQFARDLTTGFRLEVGAHRLLARRGLHRWRAPGDEMAVVSMVLAYPRVS